MKQYDIDTVRHSSAHLMAQAICRVFQDKKIQLGIGPVIDDGFYYDIDVDYKITEEDLKKVEEMMKKIIAEKLPIIRKVLTKHEAIELFQGLGQELKVELIHELPEDVEITCYSQGEFIDLCRGPHVENTSEIPTHFKLLHTAGAYWRGDSSKKMLQRVYATGFTTKDDLKAHLTFIEEAKRRDHRKLGTELELFHFDQTAPASPFFLPKGAFVYNQLIDFMRRLYAYYDYKEVITPQVMDVALWHTSGHYEHYKENMFFTELDGREFALKPMNCPAHMIMFKQTKHSYRELPLRYADFGRIHRYEKSGVTAGLTRVRTFVQDDAHIFTALNQIQEEISTLVEMFFTCYGHFGFTDVKICLATRPEKKAGDDATWDKAEEALKFALDRSGKSYEIAEGDGAFYGPKIDFRVADALKRYHQLGTIQLDFQLPERFDLNFTSQAGTEERPVVIHRALLGSLERFNGILLEHVGGAYPFWLAPDQVHIVPVRNESHLAYCEELYKELKRQQIRVVLDDRNESLGYKTRQIQKQKVPFMIVIGDKEIAETTVNMRGYGEPTGKVYSKAEMLTLFKTLNRERLPNILKEAYNEK